MNTRRARDAYTAAQHLVIRRRALAHHAIVQNFEMRFAEKFDNSAKSHISKSWQSDPYKGGDEHAECLGVSSSTIEWNGLQQSAYEIEELQRRQDSYHWSNELARQNTWRGRTQRIG